MLGWNFYTRAQAQRRLAQVGRWELEVLAKSIAPASLWPAIGTWAAELEQWLMAGYAASDISWPNPWKELAQQVLEKISKTRLKLTAQAHLHADLVIGFDPLEVHRLEAHTWGLLVESEELTPAQETQIVGLEKSLGSAHWCDAGPLPAVPAVAVDRESELSVAVEDALVKNPQITRLIWRGPAAQAATQAFVGAPKQTSWLHAQALEQIKAAAQTPEGFAERWEWLKLQTARAGLPAEELKRLQKAAAQTWEEKGRLDKDLLPAVLLTLPEQATPAQMAAASEPWNALVDMESLIDRLAPLQKLLPGGKISSSLWIDLLEPKSTAHSTYGGVQAVGFERAHGLLDDEALVVWSAAPPAQKLPLVPPAETRARNAEQFAEGATPARGWVESDPQRLLNARQSAAKKLCAWVTWTGDDLHKELNAQKCSYAWPGVQAAFPALAHKQLLRRNPQQAFGQDDYALPRPVRLSCKAWENAITAPELAWYDALKLRPLWQGGQEDPRALWIGNWVHAALKNAQNPQAALAFFLAPAPANAQLAWHEARAQAWRQVWGFARALEQAAGQLVQSEWPVEGRLDSEVFLNGRIDAWVRLPDGSMLVVDYKTSSSATPLSDKKLKIGDGLQLWLYGRLLFNQTQTPVSLCRLTFDRPLVAQLTVDATEHAIEARLKQMAQTGILGQRGWVWGRFGAQDRLPLVALPMDWRVIAKRRKESYGTVD